MKRLIPAFCGLLLGTACFPDFTLKQCYGPGDCEQGQVCRNLVCVSGTGPDASAGDSGMEDVGDTGIDDIDDGGETGMVDGGETGIVDAGPITDECHVSDEHLVTSEPLLARVALARNNRELLVGYTTERTLNEQLVGADSYLAAAQINPTPQSIGLVPIGVAQSLELIEGSANVFNISIVRTSIGFAVAWAENDSAEMNGLAVFATASASGGVSVATPRRASRSEIDVEDARITPLASGYALATSDRDTTLRYQRLDSQGVMFEASEFLSVSTNFVSLRANAAGDQITLVFSQKVARGNGKYCGSLAVASFAVDDPTSRPPVSPTYNLAPPSYTDDTALAPGPGDTIATAFTDVRTCTATVASRLYFSRSAPTQAAPVVLTTTATTSILIENVDMAYSSQRQRFGVVWVERESGGSGVLRFAEVSPEGMILGSILEITDSSESAKTPAIVDTPDGGWVVLSANDYHSPRGPELWLTTIDCR